MDGGPGKTLQRLCDAQQYSSSLAKFFRVANWDTGAATRAAGVAEDPFIISAQSLNRPALVHACGSAHTLPLYPFANVQPTLPSTVLPAPSSKNEDRSSLIPILPAPPPSTQIHIVYFSSSDIL